MTELTIEHDGVSLAAEDAGSGPPVVLLHGLTATRRYVVMGSRALERSGHRVIAYDARGHGRSSPAPERSAYRYEDLRGDLEAVLDRLEMERAVLAGSSMGAHTMLALALRAPERVAGLVVITPAYDPATQDDPARLERWDALADGLERGGVEGFIAAYGEPGVPEKLRETVLKVIRQRLALHEHPGAVADALRAVPRSRPFGSRRRAVGDPRAGYGRGERAMRPIRAIRSPSGRPMPRRSRRRAWSPTSRGIRPWRGRAASSRGSSPTSASRR